jgi:predicted ATP-grasp superfamily ATP-dependent carboligase
MRILVHEFASGGGLAGRPIPAPLAREGRAMLTALVADLASLGSHEIVTTTDCRFTLTAPGVNIVAIRPGREALSADLLKSVDAVWLIAPETGGCLERLAAAVERADRMLVGGGSSAIQRAADKAGLPRRLARCGVTHPRTYVVGRAFDLRSIANDLGYPIVVKPPRGAGCEGVSLARTPRDLRTAVERAARCSGPHRVVLLQRYVRGTPASVSLISNGACAVALSINAQVIHAGRAFSYRGGRTPLEHPLARRGIEAATRACTALPDLRGYVGVDLVLTETDAVVIEVNPRLTTAYLGVRAALGDTNISGMAIDACRGLLPASPAIRRRVHFTSAGRVAASP